MSRVRDVIQRDTRANQPAATAVDVGTLYYVTDEDVLERSSGTAWESYAPTGGAGDVVGPASVTDERVVLFDGTTGKLIKEASEGVLSTISQAEAEAGTATDRRIFTAERVAQAIAALAPSGGGSSWALVDSWTHVGNVTEVDFTNLSAYNEIAVVMVDVTTDNSRIRVLRVSTDNGSTFLSSSGDYREYDGAGAIADATYIEFHNSNSAAARGGIIVISAFNVSSAPKFATNAVHAVHRGFVIPTTTALDAIRCTVSVNGTVFTAGSIYVFGR